MHRRNRHGRLRGFTLPEILTVMAIIGTLSSVGAVSYSSVRAGARDVKRVSDLKQMQTALELYFDTHNAYPGDGQPGEEGKILGLPSSDTLSDGGFGPSVQGLVYMQPVPKNAEPGGTPYIYRALYRDGRNCDDTACDAYAILFTLERAQGSYLPGPHAMTPAGVVGAEGGYAGEGITGAGGAIFGIGGIQAQLAVAAQDATQAVVDTASDQRVQDTAEVAVAPAATAAAAINVAVAVPEAASYLGFFLTQPFAFLAARRRKKWGTVYNVLSRLGEDLVIVRLRNATTGRVVRSTVTDTEGRYSFLVGLGRYRIEASKPGFLFPSDLTAGRSEDGQFREMYHGEIIEVGEGGAVLTPNIPLDPAVNDLPDDAVRQAHGRRKLSRIVATVSPLLGILAFLVKPSAPLALLVSAQLTALLLFRRLAMRPAPKNWGIVYDQKTRRPVANAITRVFEAKYNKLLDSQVTDSQGRYHFRVGGNVYYLTANKPGYEKTQTDPVDLSQVTEPTVIASDLPLAPERIAPAAPGPAAPAPPAAV